MKKSSKKWKIPLAIGLAISIFGIILIVLGATANVPAMGEQGWFDAENKSIMLISFGGFLGFAGLITGIVASAITYNADPENQAKMVEKQKNHEKIFHEALKARGIDIEESGKNKFITCKYCGTANKEEATRCSACGAGLQKLK